MSSVDEDAPAPPARGRRAAPAVKEEAVAAPRRGRRASPSVNSVEEACAGAHRSAKDAKALWCRRRAPPRSPPPVESLCRARRGCADTWSQSLASVSSVDEAPAAAGADSASSRGRRAAATASSASSRDRSSSDEMLRSAALAEEPRPASPAGGHAFDDDTVSSKEDEALVPADTDKQRAALLALATQNKALAEALQATPRDATGRVGGNQSFGGAAERLPPRRPRSAAAAQTSFSGDEPRARRAPGQERK